MRQIWRAMMIGALLSQPVLAETYKGYEMPPFTVLERDGAFEVREYGPHVVAEVSVRGDQRAAVSTGFRRLANYIFGGNATGEKIAMTVPVSQVPDGEGAWLIRFMMPSASVAAGLPAAKNSALRFTEVPGGREAVYSFAGFGGQGAVAAATRALRAELERTGRSTSGPVRIYFYDDPFTLPWRRRNEVAVPLP